jgi:hypothetical protein
MDAVTEKPASQKAKLSRSWSGTVHSGSEDLPRNEPSGGGAQNAGGCEKGPPTRSDLHQQQQQRDREGFVKSWPT